MFVKNHKNNSNLQLYYYFTFKHIRYNLAHLQDQQIMRTDHEYNKEQGDTIKIGYVMGNRRKL